MINQQTHYILLQVLLILVCSECFNVQKNFIHKCEEEEYFDTVTLTCKNCSINQTSYQDPFSCDCKPGFIPTWLKETGTKTCIECPERHVTSSDGLHCVLCAENQTYNETLRTCDNCPQNMIAVDRYLDGSSAGLTQCIQCQEHFFPNEDVNQCIPCHTWQCSCPNSTHELLGDICASKISLSSTGILDESKNYTVRFGNEEQKSELLTKYVRMSSYKCHSLRNSSSCQLLANLCVLLLHSFNLSNACGQYWHRANGQYWQVVPFGEVSKLPSYLPMLYYDKNLPAHKVLRNSSFKAKITLRNDNYKSNFNVLVAKYSLKGNLLSYDLVENVLQICPELISNLKRLSIGDIFNSKCKLSTYDVLHRYPTEFYDVFLHYFDKDKSNMLPIPIVNLNYEFSGSRVNTYKINKWQLTHRLFLIDNQSGRPKHKHEEESHPNKYYVRFIDSIELFIHLQKESADGLIYPPYLKIRYKEATVKELNSLSYIEISFKVRYFTDMSKPLEIIKVTMAIACTFAAILALIKTWSASRRCGKQNVDITAIVHLVCLACGYLANCFYFLIFFISCVWVFIFRLQDVIWIFLPFEDQEFVFKQYIISAFSLKIIHIMYVIFNQITIDLFFIDWEQPKAYHTNYSLNYKVENKTDKVSVSIWRTYFIANEWNELQTYRKVNLSSVLFVLIFILKVSGYENVARFTISDNFDDENIPFSFIARFSLSILIFMVVCFAQELFRVIIYERYIENRLQLFVDICSMSNISVLIFKFPLYGYYIHGKSVYGEADLDMRSLFDNMKREEGDLFPKRGLEPASECQTFEVRVTPHFRLNYDSVLETFEDAPSGRPSNQKQSGKKTECCIEAHERMKTFLSIFLQHGLKGLDYTVREKLFLENALDLEFQEPKEKTLFFRDYRHSFDKVLLHGEEGVLLTFEMMVFTFVDMLSTDFILASFITYLVHKLIHAIRYEGGKRNMLHKTLVDERFLI